MFHGKPVKIKLLIKSDIAKIKLIKITDEISVLIKLPIITRGNEKNNDRNKGINIRAKGIKNLNVSSKVRE